MLPKHSGDTFTAAVGLRSLWKPRADLGLDGAANAILHRQIDVFGVARDVSCKLQSKRGLLFFDSNLSHRACM